MLDMQHLAEHFVSRVSRELGAHPLTVVVENWELADRPSLRFIARILTVGRARGAPLRWHFSSAAAKRPGGFSPWREQFLQNFARYTGAAPAPKTSPASPIQLKLGAAKSSLVDMDWDRLLPVAGGEGLPTDPELQLQYALAFFNVGGTEEGYRILCRLASEADDDAFGAHLAYLKGLVETKRFKRPEEGLRTFDEGLMRLGEPQDEQQLLSHGWLENGRSLARTVLALRSPSDSPERERSLMEVFDEQAKLYERSSRSPAGWYLRYNVLANMAFLLELIPRYGQAIRFWQGAFKKETAEAVSYRVGVLQMKAGEHEAAHASLLRALAACEAEGNRFHEAQTLYALAYACEDLGRSADDFLKRGLSCAQEIGDFVLEHLFRSWLGGARPEKRPDAKQISYVTYAELDSETGVGFQNFNDFLLSSASAGAPTDAPRGEGRA
jgi:tetratricopeptide (TPR) repeat protein